MIDDKRRAWLRGAYLDRITEAAMHYAAEHDYFVETEWEGYIGADFSYLSELKPEDHACLRELARHEAFRRIAAAISEARETAFEKLRADFADIVSSDAKFRVDLGWIDLLRHAADRVRTYPKSWKAKIVGGKEKFGCAIVHISCDYDQRGSRSEVERLREEVRLRSLATCEICGEPGRLRLSGWAKTVCERHAAVMGEFREDDGMWSDPWKWTSDRPLEDHIADMLASGRAVMADVQHQERQRGDEYPPETAELLRGMDPVRPRPKMHVVDDDSEFFPSPIRATDIGSRVDDDTWSREGREQELLIEFGFQIIDAVNGACVKPEYLDKYVLDEIAGWRELAVQPLSESDEVFLQGYVRELIDEEYERIRLKQEAERNND
ncbi:hypothetical protein N5K21_22495 [Rhizobium pusense]|uniref:Uncharacterized protein n=1 Tax=Agrobacterium pusense TaxID=648995 RepID=A0A6H0ZRK3_9HYPH|nr:hypothetical protein [Agrobacterium pusense]MDH2091505.1 hypothetical protein [Agrobacterium pusense]QIX22644.1 hypothetical protein FOB41_16590 [Agrobacterium pusense]WCK24556.1 hypothetical protein CFBP5496_0002890 [Agrobacterium pusense]